MLEIFLTLFRKRFNLNPKNGLIFCGTTSVFSDSEIALLHEFSTFKMCTVGSKTKIIGNKTIPQVTDAEFECFDK